MSWFNKPLEVIVFGNIAVGKTSMLSSMYMEMEAQNVTSCNGMTFSATSDEFNVLRKKWLELRERITQGAFALPLDMDYQPTISKFNEHSFEFKTRGKNQRVNFVDTRGGLTDSSDSELIKRVNESFLTICVVDASILMGCNDLENEKQNSPLAIKKILWQILNDNDHKQPQSCLFVLTKCEKWMRTKEERDRMAKTFEKIFQPVLDFAVEKRFPLFYLPVQTIGCVEFSRIDPVTKEMKFKAIGGTFQPVDVIFPLAFLLKVLLQNRTWFEWILDLWFKDYEAYYQGLKEKVGVPIDFRGNKNGSGSTLESMDFWE